jgi:hypothetical protein
MLCSALGKLCAFLLAFAPALLLHRNMALILLFLLGVGNFAMHKAVLESGHPILAQMPGLFQPLGGRLSLILEFGVLVGTMLMAAEGSAGWVWGYAIYTALNASSVWMILSGRI